MPSARKITKSSSSRLSRVILPCTLSSIIVTPSRGIFKRIAGAIFGGASCGGFVAPCAVVKIFCALLGRGFALLLLKFLRSHSNNMPRPLQAEILPPRRCESILSDCKITLLSGIKPNHSSPRKIACFGIVGRPLPIRILDTQMHLPAHVKGQIIY